jgi:hypothetical protein
MDMQIREMFFMEKGIEENVYVNVPQEFRIEKRIEENVHVNLHT